MKMEKNQAKKGWRKNQILMTTALVLVAVIVSISFTVAYFSDKKAITNTFEFGEIKIQVLETRSDWNPSKGARTISPGGTLTKDPSVKNVGTAPCYVRAWVSINDGVTGYKQEAADFITMGALNSQWKVAAGQTWNSKKVLVYYDGELAKNAETPPIFETVTLNATNTAGDALLEGADQGFDILVDVQAVQSRVEGSTVSMDQAFLNAD